MARIIAIGASQGGVRALLELMPGLVPSFPAPVVVTLHIGPGPSEPPEILAAASGIPSHFARHGEPLLPGQIYIAPPDRHLLVMENWLELSAGPRENWARPAIDPLLRSVALAHGSGAIGVVLSGRLNDGTAGLYEIKSRGGIAIVQTPLDADAPDMPRSALENVRVDYCLPVREMPRLLNRLAQEDVPDESLDIRALAGLEQEEPQKPAAQTCPECGGAMRQEMTGTLTRFRCHTGHVMTAEVLAASQLESLRAEISSTFRLLNERVALCRELAGKYRARGDSVGAEAWERAAEEAARREQAAQVLTGLDWHHPEVEAPE